VIFLIPEIIYSAWLKAKKINILGSPLAPLLPQMDLLGLSVAVALIIVHLLTFFLPFSLFMGGKIFLTEDFSFCSNRQVTFIKIAAFLYFRNWYKQLAFASLNVTKS
jgi:hypothetical protein